MEGAKSVSTRDRKEDLSALPPARLRVSCDDLRLQQGCFAEDGLRHVKREPHTVLARCLTGWYEIRIEGRFVRVAPGEWYVSRSHVHRDIVHRRAPDGPMQTHWIKARFLLNGCLDYDALWIFPLHWRGTDAERLDGFWARLARGTAGEPLRALAVRQRLAMELLDLLCARGHPVPDWESRLQFSERLAKLADFVDVHLSAALSPTELAQVFGVSESHLYAVFRRQAGCSPAAFVKRRRIATAGQLLETTELGLKEIAGRVGFANPYHLSREFRRIHGLSPREYRRQNRLGRLWSAG